jgi:prevent-host-death family protein
VPDVSATHAARNFADLLDAVEHRGERYTIVRRGRVVAHLAPPSKGRGSEVRAALARHRPDDAWRLDLESVRDLVVVDERR